MTILFLNDTTACIVPSFLCRLLLSNVEICGLCVAINFDNLLFSMIFIILSLKKMFF